MTRLELIQELQVRRAHFGYREAADIVNTMFEVMAEGLAAGEHIEIRGFGTFDSKPRAARRGRNPKTGAAVEVEAKLTPFFRAGKELRAEVNRAAASAPSRSERD